MCLLMLDLYLVKQNYFFCDKHIVCPKIQNSVSRFLVEYRKTYFLQNTEILVFCMKSRFETIDETKAEVK